MAGTSPNSKFTFFEKEIFETFVHPGEVTEVRVPSFKGRINGENVRGTVTGYFDDHNAFCDAVAALERQHVPDGREKDMLTMGQPSIAKPYVIFSLNPSNIIFRVCRGWYAP